MVYRYLIFLGLVSFITNSCYAHDDLDLGIESVSLDKDCRAKIVIKNYGWQLTDAFYKAVNPAHVSIVKGEQQEQFKSLRALDKKRALKEPGGTLTLYGKTAFTRNPVPIELNIQFAFEFGDYGAGNNRLLQAMDCEIGKGQVAGAPIVYTQPDIAIREARIDPKTCLLSVQLANLTGVALASQSWQRDQGVAISFLDLQTHERAADIALAEIDPNMHFTNRDRELHWQGELPFADATKIQLGLWRVLGDLDFSNNTAEVAVPNSCSRPQN